MIFDTFMLNDELDMLECRLTELQDVNLTHVIVEANVTHQDRPKPYHYLENIERFAPWKDRIIHVKASNLPLKTMNPDPWAREHAQREWIAEGLKDAERDDVILQSDVDEIPTAVAARNVRPQGGMVAFDQTFHCFAVDWLHPERWRGTVAARAASIQSFGAMRDARNFAPPIPNAGWHFSWVGGTAYAHRKLNSFCHPEIADRVAEGLARDEYLIDGWHVDGTKLQAVDAAKWPRWVAERRCPPTWFRPRLTFREDWFGTDSRRALADLYRRTQGLTGSIVEVGCWEGCSTVALANAANPEVVHAVDTWEGSPGEISETLAAERDVFGTFRDNIDIGTGGNVEAHRMGWRDYFATDRGPLKFVHIDATHTYEEVRDNIAAVLPLMVPGGVICGDDMHHPPVKQAVLEAFPEAHTTATLWFQQI